MNPEDMSVAPGRERERRGNLLRFGDGKSDESESVRLGGRVKLPSNDATGYSSSSVSSEPEENVREGVGEILRSLFLFGGRGDTTV